MKTIKTAIYAIALLGGMFAYADTKSAVEVVLDASYTPFTDLNGEKVLINDRTYILFGEKEFKQFRDELKMLGSIASRRWKDQHSTERGRVEWHGKKIGTKIDEKAKTKTTEYEDGYKHIETFKAVGIKRAIRKENKTLAEPIKVKDLPKPRRLIEFEKKAREGITINHEVR